MDGALTTVAEERVPTCTLCHRSLKEPKVLPCLHMFCTSCLEHHFENFDSSREVQCPSCHEPVTIPPGGIVDLRSASHIASLTEILDSHGKGICQFCPFDNSAEVYCVDCTLPMCHPCQTQHGRVKGTAKHTLITFSASESPVSSVAPVLKQRERGCSHHGQTPLQYYCLTCDEIICFDCRHSSHEAHKVDTLGKIADNRRQSLMDLKGPVCDYRSKTKTNIQEATKYIVTLKEEFKKAEREIESNAKTLISQIEAKKEDALEELRKRRIEEEMLVYNHLDNLKKTDQEVDNTSNFLEGILSFACDAEVAEISSVLKERFTALRQNEDFLLNRKLRIKQFQTNIVELPFLEDLFGVEFKISYPEVKPASIMSSFEADSSITGIAATADDRIILTSYTSKTCSLYKRTGERVCEVKHGLVQPISVAVYTSEKILVTDIGDGEKAMGIKAFTTKGTPISCNINLPDSPWGLARTRSGNLVVCHPQRRNVTIYSMDGQVIQVLKAGDRRTLFGNPRCVAVNINDDIVVSDFGRHCIKIFDADGKLKVSYGSEGSGFEQLRHPCGVCTDKYGNIIVADSDNHRILLLTAEGQFHASLLTENDGLKEPVAVTIDSRGDLVVGDWEGKIYLVRYL